MECHMYILYLQCLSNKKKMFVVISKNSFYTFELKKYGVVNFGCIFLYHISVYVLYGNLIMKAIYILNVRHIYSYLS